MKGTEEKRREGLRTTISTLWIRILVGESWYSTLPAPLILYSPSIFGKGAQLANGWMVYSQFFRAENIYIG